MLCLSCTVLAQGLSAQSGASIQRGLVYLAQQQSRDGAIACGGPKVAMTGLSVLAFLSAGHVPDTGRFGLTVRRAVDFLLEQNPEAGYYGQIDNSRMYGQGIITLALIQAWGVEPDGQKRQQIRQAVERAVRVIIEAQAVKKNVPWVGGWRYQPDALDSDLSLSGWNALALRAAQHAGLEVPRERADQAVAFVLQCWRPAERGFAYQPGQAPAPGMTAVGMLNLYLLGAADRPELTDAAQFLIDKPLSEEMRFFYYSAHAVAQAAHQSGEPTFSQVWNPLQQRLLGLQQEDGGWPPSRTNEEPGRVYTTNLAVLTLTVPAGLLPIYQQ